MRAKKLILSAICSIGLVAGPASAASESGKMEANRRIMFDYAKCVVRLRHDRTAEAILSNADNDTIQKRYSDLIIEECAATAAGDGVEMRFGVDLFRYALADALVNADFSSTGESDFSNRLPLAHIATPSQSEFDTYLLGVKSKRQREAAKVEFDKRVGVAWLSRFGECVVRQDPVKSRLWLLTPTGAAEESSRINDLRPTFAICLGQGSARFNRITMRGTVALNYYRLAKATVQPATGTTH